MKKWFSPPQPKTCPFYKDEYVTNAIITTYRVTISLKYNIYDHNKTRQEQYLW